MDQRIFLTDRRDSQETSVKLLTTKRFRKKKQAVWARTTTYDIMAVKRWTQNVLRCGFKMKKCFYFFYNLNIFNSRAFDTGSNIVSFSVDGSVAQFNPYI